MLNNKIGASGPKDSTLSRVCLLGRKKNEILDNKLLTKEIIKVKAKA
jgi:hypothetical protein